MSNKVHNEAQALTDKLVDLTNSMGNKSEDIGAGIAEGLMRSHRTLQQSFISSLQKALVLYAESNTDLRNEGAVAWAKQVAQLDINTPFI